MPAFSTPPIAYIHFHQLSVTADFSMVGIFYQNSADLFSKNRDVSISSEKTQKATSGLTVMRGVFRM